MRWCGAVLRCAENDRSGKSKSGCVSSRCRRLAGRAGALPAAGTTSRGSAYLTILPVSQLRFISTFESPARPEQEVRLRTGSPRRGEACRIRAQHGPMQYGAGVGLSGDGFGCQPGGCPVPAMSPVALRKKRNNGRGGRQVATHRMKLVSVFWLRGAGFHCWALRGFVPIPTARSSNAVPTNPGASTTKFRATLFES